MRLLASIALSLIAPAIVLAAEPFSGTVTDRGGAPIPDAMVIIHWDSAGSAVGLTANVGIKADIVIRTKHDGTFIVDLPPGFYDVFVSATAFSPACRKIRVKPGKVVPVIWRLPVDPMLLDEIAGPMIEVIPPQP